MSSDYTIFNENGFHMHVIEQSMQYEIGMEYANVYVASPEFTPEQFKDLIKQMIRVYSYQHPGQNVLDLSDEIRKLK